MPRTRLNVESAEGVDEIEGGSFAAVKQLVRYMAKNAAGLASGADSIEVIDAELTEWVSSGYELVSAHYIGENPEGIGMIYVLARK